MRCCEYIGVSTLAPQPQRMLHSLLAQAAHALPSQCMVCRAWGPVRVCNACTSRFSRPVARCSTCALPLTGNTSPSITQCGECLLHPSALDACIAVVDYGYPWDGLLAQLKFNGHSHSGGAGPNASVARAIADTMRPLPAAQTALQRADFIVPIPLAAQRLRQRGFNQALEIAKHVLGTGAVARAKLRPQMLLRTRDTAPQVGLPRAERLHNMRHAFAVEPSLAGKVQDASLVLVDDVTTTTATLCAAALALRAAGAARVTGLVFARTLASD
jgi:ComF family protein